jgi:hypothetical protein
MNVGISHQLLVKRRYSQQHAATAPAIDLQELEDVLGVGTDQITDLDLAHLDV